MAASNNDDFQLHLTEHKVESNIPKGLATIAENFSVEKFKNTFSTVIVRYTKTEMEFDLIGINPFLANTFRRLIISDVPSMAIDRVVVANNSSVMQDEVLAHRLGLIPLMADARWFEIRKDPSAPLTENDTLEFELKIKCTLNKESSKKESSRTEDMYKNPNVYSKHIKWIPMGNQKNKFKDADVGPIHSDILINKMRPGHELDLKLYAFKSNGRDHAKFSPVETAFYRFMPHIEITKPVEDEAAYRLQSSFSPGVIGIRKEGKRKYAFVNDARYDTSSRNVLKHDDLKDCVVMTKLADHCIFTIESLGAQTPDIIFKESISILREKCTSLLNELNTTN